MNRHSARIVALAALCLPLAAGCGAANDPAEEQAAQAIEKLGGTMHRDANRPGNPVTFVNLSSIAVSGADLETLKDLTQLEVLFLSDMKLTDADLAHLPIMKHLKWLYLDNTSITDAGLSHLQALPNLRRLFLSGTRTTGKGLARLKQFKHLELVSLYKTQVTDAEVEDFQKALPDVRVMR